MELLEAAVVNHRCCWRPDVGLPVALTDTVGTQWRTLRLLECWRLENELDIGAWSKCQVEGLWGGQQHGGRDARLDKPQLHLSCANMA